MIVAAQRAVELEEQVAACGRAERLAPLPSPHAFPGAIGVLTGLDVAVLSLVGTFYAAPLRHPYLSPTLTDAQRDQARRQVVASSTRAERERAFSGIIAR